ncbi:MAG: aspartate carbamoyltransferase, partial [Deltaproteobacteria bacterium CG_4_10_14_0_2_um_filter_43_8]
MSNLSCRHLLSINNLSNADVELILSTAESFKDISEREIKKVPTLRGKTVVNCFFETSTRTRMSFEVAEKRLSADILNFSASGSAMSKKGESLNDTLLNIEAMNPDVWIIRHGQSGAAKLASELVSGHVINAGDGAHEHPTQALLDLFTIKEKKKKVKGLKVAIVGDIAHSRVARSNMILFSRMGMEVFVSGPPTLMPPGLEQYNVTVVTNTEEIIPELDVLMALRIQRERMGEQYFPNDLEYAKYFGIDDEKLKGAK